MLALSPPSRPPLHQYWNLDPEYTYLNHGSFGACPTTILQIQQEFQQRLERQPMNFLARDLEQLWDQSRQRLAEFLGALPTNLVFVPNATTGVNTVLRSLCFQPGQEILTTDHAYNACRNALDYVAEKSGATVVVAAVPFPLNSAAEIVAPILAAVTPHTRVVLLDHVSSQTGLVFPLEQLIPALSQQGIATLIDGAHAAGMLPLQLESLGATYYSGNCHKWLCAPKGAGFLYVQPQQQHQIRPLTISHGANSARTDRSRFWLEFDWVGTDDPSSYLCVAHAIDWLEHLIPGGWSAIQRHNHNLAVKARQQICEQLGLKIPCPDSLLGSLASMILPNAPDCSLAEHLWQTFKIEVPVFAWPTAPHRILRISANLYNQESDYAYLAAALEQLI
jgi:isopenicillin-N epimerase